jgi:hypothetical protein
MASGFPAVIDIDQERRRKPHLCQQACRQMSATSAIPRMCKIWSSI